MSDTPARFTLRQLPLPAKIVVTVFLFAVGLGYVSAMVQLHINHSDRDGNPLPTPANVIERFSGLKAFDPNAPVPCSRMETLLTGNPKAAEVTKDNMAPAFFAASKDWAKESAAPRRDPGGRTPAVAVEDLREGERLALLAWVRSEDRTAKQAAYEGDRFPLPEPLKALKVTEEFLTPAQELKVRSLLEVRCQYCHKEQEPKLATYAALEKWVNPPSQELIDGKWVRSPKQMSVEKLTQSTHAHLLSFAVLFGVTGLLFAFTSYPGILRATLGPVVLLAQVADISCWWLARMAPPYGPTFALTIMGTGAVVGLGLVLQIILSLLNLYGLRGKVLIVLLMAVVGGGLGYVGLKVIQPALDDEKAAATKLAEPGKLPNGTPGKVDPPMAPVSRLEKLIMGPREGAAWNGKGSMAPAFFEKESEFKKLKRMNSPDLPKLEAERQSERLAIQAWIQAEPAARKKAYDEDKLPLPASLTGKPLTEEFSAEGGKFVKVKSILDTRCVNCHAVGAEQQDLPLETYEQLMKYVDANPVQPVIPPAKVEAPPMPADLPAAKKSHLEALIMGPREGVEWNGDGSMAAAFFEREGGFKKLKAKKDPELPKVEAEREGERLALQAWIRAEPTARKKAYDEDKFPLPEPLRGKPITAEYADEKKHIVKVKSLLDERCVKCHSVEGQEDKFPLEKYEQLLPYLEVKPEKAKGK